MSSGSGGRVDGLTLAVEIIGAVILLVWAVVPVMEFRAIFRNLKRGRRGRERQGGGR